MTLSLVSDNVAQGGVLLLAYSAGLAIPFLIAATQISLVTNVLRKYGKVMHYVEIALGIFLIGIGVMLFFGRFEIFATLGTAIDGFDEIVIGQYLLIAIGILGLLGLIPAYIAHQKGRQFIDWWFFGSLLFPIALPYAIMLKPISDENQLSEGQVSESN
jgi:thiol:disulfide interchange protein